MWLLLPLGWVYWLWVAVKIGGFAMFALALFPITSPNSASWRYLCKTCCLGMVTHFSIMCDRHQSPYSLSLANCFLAFKSDSPNSCYPRKVSDRVCGIGIALKVVFISKTSKANKTSIKTPIDD
jgi:hypothetical protein